MIDPSAVLHKANYLVDRAFAGTMEKHSKIMAEKLWQINYAVKTGSRKRIKNAQQLYLRSFSVKLCSVVHSVEKNEHVALKSTRLIGMAQDLDPFLDPKEPVRVYAKVKSIRGDWRPICKFGPRRKALQTLASNLLLAKFGLHPIDFMARGRGTEIAADHILRMIDGGISHFVVADIASCFRSVKQEEIANRLGLPPAMVRHCLLIGEGVPLVLPSVLPPDTDPKAFGEAVRQGLPQGARSSNRVISQLLGPELGSLTSGNRIVLYGDDFAVPAATHVEAEAIAKTLHEFMLAHPVGPFRLKRCEVRHADMGFDFLKYYFRRDQITRKARLRPSNLSYYRFSENIRSIVAEEPPQHMYKAVINYRDRWLASFRRYKANDEALGLLWQSTIVRLPPPLYAKWEQSCQHYKSKSIWPPGTKFSWIE